jgi:hypothetical protein
VILVRLGLKATLVVKVQLVVMVRLVHKGLRELLELLVLELLE